jgi:hypothetical protein
MRFYLHIGRARVFYIVLGQNVFVGHVLRNFVLFLDALSRDTLSLDVLSKEVCLSTSYILTCLRTVFALYQEPFDFEVSFITTTFPSKIILIFFVCMASLLSASDRMSLPFSYGKFLFNY